MRTSVITIVGLGPRGLTMLDRMVEAYQCFEPACNLEVHAVDPREPGQGVHYRQQPDHLVTNTIAGMITMFPHEGLMGEPRRPAGPSLPEWARLVGYRRFQSGFFPTGDDAGEKVSDHDYLPRRMLGEYLTWYYDRIVASLPRGVSVIHHRDRAADLHPLGEGRHIVVLETGFRIDSDFVLITTGHGTTRPSAQERELDTFARAHAHKNPLLSFIREPYPIDRLVRISPRAAVAVQGLGLTAHDIISELTVGRGGSFVSDGRRLRYRKCGREPRLLLFSRNGLPFTARGKHQKQPGKLYKPRFFTKEAVRSKCAERLERHGSPALDFDQDLVPLLIKEMACVYRATRDGLWPDPTNYVVDEQDRYSVEQLLYPLKDREFQDLEEYRGFFLRYIEEDLAHAARGNVHGPEKAAIEVIRDARQTFRLAVEYGGLTPESHARFLEHHMPNVSRVTFGPPARRNYELLALFEAGIVDLAGGPGPTVSMDSHRCKFVIESQFAGVPAIIESDVLIVGRIDTVRPLRESSPFITNLLRRGLIRPYLNGEYHPGGLDIDRQNHPVDRHGRPLTNVWAVGYPVEGPNYFTYALPLPGVRSQQIIDADKCVMELFRMLGSPG